jgi:hypothetical protein
MEGWKSAGCRPTIEAAEGSVLGMHLSSDLYAHTESKQVTN